MLLSAGSGDTSIAVTSPGLCAPSLGESVPATAPKILNMSPTFHQAKLLDIGETQGALHIASRCVSIAGPLHHVVVNLNAELRLTHMQRGLGALL